MKSDSVIRLWVKTAEGLVLVEQGAPIKQDDLVIDLACNDDAGEAEKPANAPRLFSPSDNACEMLGKATRAGRPYPFD